MMRKMNQSVAMLPDRTTFHPLIRGVGNHFGLHALQQQELARFYRVIRDLPDASEG